jgi:replicative DNA helicase
MSYNSIGFRFDTLLGHFSNKNLMFGNDEEAYEAFIEELKTHKNKFIVATPADFGKEVTVSKLRNFVKQNDLHLLAIDGIKYLRDERGRKGDNLTTSLTNISEDLMELSVELKIPIMVVVQANRNGVRSAEEDGTPELEDIRDSDGIGHNATRVISLKQKTDGVLEMSIKKNRYGAMGARLNYMWNIDTGEFTFLSVDEKGTTRRKPTSNSSDGGETKPKQNRKDVF